MSFWNGQKSASPAPTDQKSLPVDDAVVIPPLQSSDPQQPSFSIRGDVIRSSSGRASSSFGTPSFVMPVGSVIMHFGDTVPAGWLELDGRDVQSTEYPSLYQQLGNKINRTSSERFSLPKVAAPITGAKYIIKC